VTPRSAWLLSLALAVATAVAIATIDVPVARAVGGGVAADLVRSILHAVDVATGLTIHRLLAGTLLVVAGAFAARRAPQAAAALVFIGMTNLAARLAGSALKDLFGRVRPFEALERGTTLGEFFAGGQSFPSGHIAHYAGLLVPLAILSPRARVPAFLALAGLALGRVLLNYHYVGDVLASITVAAAFAALFAPLVRPPTPVA
jgi:membrane-associated phospholipid phosphatase